MSQCHDIYETGPGASVGEIENRAGARGAQCHDPYDEQIPPARLARSQRAKKHPVDRSSERGRHSRVPLTSNAEDHRNEVFERLMHAGQRSH